MSTAEYQMATQMGSSYFYNVDLLLVFVCTIITIIMVLYAQLLR
jgi:hypothetical protein